MYSPFQAPDSVGDRAFHILTDVYVPHAAILLLLNSKCRELKQTAVIPFDSEESTLYQPEDACRRYAFTVCSKVLYI